jgi:molybdate transport system substrate-binding protein
LSRSAPLSSRPLGIAFVVVLLNGILAACGSDSDSPSNATKRATAGDKPVVVSAATSLNKALTSYGDRFRGGKVRLSFAGSDALAAQIRQGVGPDVFASANTKLPNQLLNEKLVTRPRMFATNKLVLAVPVGEKRVTSIDDLADSGVAIAAGADGVPIGEYTKKVLARLPRAQAQRILANVRSKEPDVGGIVGKLTQSAVDAGFVYASDVKGAGGRLRAIELPARLQPTVEYAVAVVRGAPNPAGARAFIAGLLKGEGARTLKLNGFGPPPGAR